MNIDTASNTELQGALGELEAAYEALRARDLSLDLTRGKPGPQQVELSSELDGILQGFYYSKDGTDVRNYGGLDGLPEAKALFGGLFDLEPGETLIGGNSSLSLMYMTIDFAYSGGLCGPGSAWGLEDPVKFLCPAPGYDRHFAVCEHLGIDMIPVAIGDTGPDMDQVEALVAEDPTIKGIWCVPRFSNPTGCVYDDATVDRLARLPLAAGRHFLVMWDNAYAVHALTPDAPALASISAACRRHNTMDQVLQFGSTSKITFAGAGVAFMGSSVANIDALKAHLGFQTIGPDKVNQLRHTRFLEDREALDTHMRRHADIIRPRFDAMLEVLDRELADTGMGHWTRPQGGYFISFDTRPGLAREVVALAGRAGVRLTPAGATFPYGEDPSDSNIRLAPTYPSLEDVAVSAEAFALCVKLASVRQALSSVADAGGAA